MARRGDLADAEELIREAAEIVEPMDYAILHLELAFARADVARLAGLGSGGAAAVARRAA